MTEAEAIGIVEQAITTVVNTDDLQLNELLADGLPASSATGKQANIGGAAGGWRGGDSAVPPAFTGADRTRLNWEWTPALQSGDSAIRESWHVLNGRIRDLIRNNPVLSKTLKMMVTLAVGKGIKAFSEAENSDGSYNEEFATTSDEEFEWWAKNEADHTRRGTLWDMQRLDVKEMFQTGLSIWLEVMSRDRDREYPLAYQLIEYEQIDRTKDFPSSVNQGGIRTANGLVINRFNQVQGVWLYDEHPGEGFYAGNNIPAGFVARPSLKSTLVPIRRIILNYVPDRVSSNIGITWFSTLVQTVRDLDKMVANELTTRAVAALMTLFVKRQNPGSTIADSLDADSERPHHSKVKMGYPAIVEIGQDDDIEIAQSKGGSDDAKTFVDLLLGQVAMGANISVNRLKGDPEESNLASILSAHRDDERTIGPIQDHLVSNNVEPIRKRFDEVAAALGKYSSVGVTPAVYEQRKRKLQKIFVVPCGDPDVQPKDEGEAAIDRLRSGLTSPQYEIAKHSGRYWRHTLKQIKQYQDALKANDLGHPDWTKGAGGTFLAFVPMDEQPQAVMVEKQSEAKEKEQSQVAKADSQNQQNRQKKRQAKRIIRR